MKVEEKEMHETYFDLAKNIGDSLVQTRKQVSTLRSRLLGEEENIEDRTEPSTLKIILSNIGADVRELNDYLERIVNEVG